MNSSRLSWLPIGALLLVVMLGGCISREKLPGIEETLPPGFDEKTVPADFLRDIAGDLGRDVAWVRCFDCGLDWQGLSGHLAGALQTQGYTDNTDAWLRVMIDESEVPEEHARRIFKFYSSPSGLGHIMVINVEYLRSVASESIGTGGDYMVLAAYDRLEHYR